MSVSGQAFVDRIIYLALYDVQPWGKDVYPDYVPADNDAPYVIYSLMSGVNVYNRKTKRMWRGVYNVKAVATRRDIALLYKYRIEQILKDAGSQEADALADNSVWAVSTVTMNEDVFIPEMVDGALRYHAGNQYVFIAEEK